MKKKKYEQISSHSVSSKQGQETNYGMADHSQTAFVVQSVPLVFADEGGVLHSRAPSCFATLPSVTCQQNAMEQ